MVAPLKRPAPKAPSTPAPNPPAVNVPAPPAAPRVAAKTARVGTAQNPQSRPLVSLPTGGGPATLNLGGFGLPVNLPGIAGDLGAPPLPEAPGLPHAYAGAVARRAPAPATLACPRCGTLHTQKGRAKTWAKVLALVLMLFTLFLSLFLLIREENLCFDCNWRWKS